MEVAITIYSYTTNVLLNLIRYIITQISLDKNRSRPFSGAGREEIRFKIRSSIAVASIVRKSLTALGASITFGRQKPLFT